MTWVRGIGQLIVEASRSSGFGISLLLDALRNAACVLTVRRIRDILDLLFQYILIAFPVVSLVSVVIGMILAIGMGTTLADFGQEYRIGWLVSATIVREMGPLMTAFILAASLGSGVAAEIGTMKVSEEIDALEVMSISPVRFLIVPRLIALTLITPIMTVFANYIAIYGGALVSRSQFEVSFVTYELQALDAIDLKDVAQSCLKACVFGGIIALVGCTQGLLTTGGATGVGRATRRSVVVAFLLVLVVSYILSWVIYRMIRLRDVHKSFGSRSILAGLDLDIDAGETFVIIGRSGIGKSVTLRHIVGLLQPDSGQVEVFDHDLATLSERELKAHRRRVGYLFQDGALLNWMNIEDNVALPLREHEKLSKSEVAARVQEVLGLVELEEHGYKLPTEISGGMRKRAGLARALVSRPDIVLYDEPTSGLDPISSSIINALVRSLQTRLGITQVVVTHDMHSAYTIADRIGMLHEGRIQALGTPDEIRASESAAVTQFIHGRIDGPLSRHTAGSDSD